MFNGGNELQDELGLDVYWADLRTYDPWGRLGWWQVDPKVDDFYRESPYNFSHNNPIRYNDPKGDCPECLVSLATADAAVNPNGVGAHALGFAQGIQNSVTGLINAVAHPIETAEGLGNLALAGLSQGNPGAAMQIDNALGTHSYETGMAVSNALATGANNLLNGNGMQRGQVLGEVAGAVIGSRGGFLRR